MPRDPAQIDPLSDDLITIDEAAKLVPGRPHRHSVYRWSLYERRGHKLETVLVSGRRYTTRNALREYLQNVSTPTGDPRTYRGRVNATRAARAQKRLAKSGI